MRSTAAVATVVAVQANGSLHPIAPDPFFPRAAMEQCSRFGQDFEGVTASDAGSGPAQGSVALVARVDVAVRIDSLRRLGLVCAACQSTCCPGARRARTAERAGAQLYAERVCPISLTCTWSVSVRSVAVFLPSLALSAGRSSTCTVPVSIRLGTHSSTGRSSIIGLHPLTGDELWRQDVADGDVPTAAFVFAASGRLLTSVKAGSSQEALLRKRVSAGAPPPYSSTATALSNAWPTQLSHASMPGPLASADGVRWTTFGAYVVRPRAAPLQVGLGAHRAASPAQGLPAPHRDEAPARAGPDRAWALPAPVPDAPGWGAAHMARALPSPPSLPTVQQAPTAMPLPAPTLPAPAHPGRPHSRISEDGMLLSWRAVAAGLLLFLLLLLSVAHASVKWAQNRQPHSAAACSPTADSASVPLTSAAAATEKAQEALPPRPPPASPSLAAAAAVAHTVASAAAAPLQWPARLVDSVLRILHAARHSLRSPSLGDPARRAAGVAPVGSPRPLPPPPPTRMRTAPPQGAREGLLHLHTVAPSTSERLTGEGFGLGGWYTPSRPRGAAAPLACTPMLRPARLRGAAPVLATRRFVRPPAIRRTASEGDIRRLGEHGTRLACDVSTTVGSPGADEEPSAAVALTTCTAHACSGDGEAGLDPAGSRARRRSEIPMLPLGAAAASPGRRFVSARVQQWSDSEQESSVDDQPGGTAQQAACTLVQALAQLARSDSPRELQDSRRSVSDSLRGTEPDALGLPMDAFQVWLAMLGAPMRASRPDSFLSHSWAQPRRPCPGRPPLGRSAFDAGLTRARAMLRPCLWQLGYATLPHSCMRRPTLPTRAPPFRCCCARRRDT